MQDRLEKMMLQTYKGIGQNLSLTMLGVFLQLPLILMLFQVLALIWAAVVVQLNCSSILLQLCYYSCPTAINCFLQNQLNFCNKKANSYIALSRR